METEREGELGRGDTRVPDRPRVGDRFVLLGEDYTLSEILKEDAYALTLLLDGSRGERVVFKRSRFLWYFGYRPPRFLERFLARKEISNYRKVDGIPGVPRFLGQIGDDSHLHEYVEGVTLNVYPGAVKDSFFDDLDEILSAVHERGLAYVDFAKDENIVVSEEGDPCLIDFQICLDHAGKRGLLAPFYRWLGRRLMREDRFHLAKHRRRYRPDQAALRKDGEPQKSLGSRVWRVVVKGPYNVLTRRIPQVLVGRSRASRRTEDGRKTKSGRGDGITHRLPVPPAREERSKTD